MVDSFAHEQTTNSCVIHYGWVQLVEITLEFVMIQFLMYTRPFQGVDSLYQLVNLVRGV